MRQIDRLRGQPSEEYWIYYVQSHPWWTFLPSNSKRQHPTLPMRSIYLKYALGMNILPQQLMTVLPQNIMVNNMLIYEMVKPQQN